MSHSDGRFGWLIACHNSFLRPLTAAILALHRMVEWVVVTAGHLLRFRLSFRIYLATADMCAVPTPHHTDVSEAHNTEIDVSAKRA